MIDAEDLYHLLRNVCEEQKFELSDDADEALADAARQVVEGHATNEDVILEGAMRGPNAKYSMYSAAGNDAVASMVLRIAEGIREGQVTRRELPALIEKHREEVAKTHGEVFDTEPRCAILDELDKVCEEQGWKSLDDF